MLGFRIASPLTAALRSFRFATSSATKTAASPAAAFKPVQEVATKTEYNQSVADAKQMHSLLAMYQKLPVEKVEDDAGTLSANMDIGEYVRMQIAKERARKTPPWFYPTYLLPAPQNIPKGCKLEFSYKYKYEFVRATGVEPAMNRVCRMRAWVSDLKLSPIELAVFKRIVGARLENGVVLIASRSRPTRRENEVLAMWQLDQALGAAKSIAAQLQGSDGAASSLTAEQIAEIESRLPPEPIKMEEQDEQDLSERMKRVEEVVEVFGDNKDEFYGSDVMDEATMQENAAKLKASNRMQQRLSAARSGSQSIDDDDDDDVAPMTPEEMSQMMQEVKATMQQLATADQLTPEQQELARQLGVKTKAILAKEAAAAAKAAEEAAAAAAGKKKKGGKK